MLQSIDPVRIGRTLARLLPVLALTLVLAAPSALSAPRKRGWLGAGLTTRSVSGNLDGTSELFSDPANGPFIAVAKPDSGAGVSLQGGALFTPNLGFDIVLELTSHDATHASLPGQTIDTGIGSLVGSLRGMLPLGDTLELFARAGVGVYVVSYTANTRLTGSPLLQDSTLSGTGISLGGGLSYFLDALAIDLAYTHHNVTLDQASSAGISGETPEIGADFGSLTLALRVFFGADL